MRVSKGDGRTAMYRTSSLNYWLNDQFFEGLVEAVKFAKQYGQDWMVDVLYEMNGREYRVVWARDGQHKLRKVWSKLEGGEW